MADAVRQGVEVRVCFDVIVLTLHEVFEGGAQRDIRALAIADAHGRATEGLAEPVAEAVGQVTLHAARERALIQMSYATHSIPAGHVQSRLSRWYAGASAQPGQSDC